MAFDKRLFRGRSCRTVLSSVVTAAIVTLDVIILFIEDKTHVKCDFKCKKICFTCYNSIYIGKNRCEVYSMNLSGLSKQGRERLSLLLRETDVVMTIEQAADILDVPRIKAAKILAGFAKGGWISRIAAGVYMPVPLEAEDNSPVPQEPFAIAEKLFSPCYISGWSAAEYWGLTDQIFQSIIVMTQKQQRNYSIDVNGTRFLLHLVKLEMLFGLKSIWKDGVKVKIADVHRTVLDAVNNPELVGGVRMAADILQSYFNSKEKDLSLMLSYLEKFGRGVAYKRIGFLVEKFYPDEESFILACSSRISAGYSKLDAKLNCNKLVAKWGLKVPESWKE